MGPIIDALGSLRKPGCDVTTLHCKWRNSRFVSSSAQLGHSGHFYLLYLPWKRSTVPPLAQPGVCWPLEGKVFRPDCAFSLPVPRAEALTSHRQHNTEPVKSYLHLQHLQCKPESQHGPAAALSLSVVVGSMC